MTLQLMKLPVISGFAYVFFAGCSSDSQADYVGVWQSSEKRPHTVEIRKEGDNFVFQDLRATKITGEREGPMALSKQGSQLVLSNGLAGIPIGLSADKNSLILAGTSLTRVPKSDAERIKRDIETQYTQRIANKAKCESLGQEAKKRENEINQSKSPGQVRLTESNALKADVTQRASQIPGCNPLLLFY